MSDELDLTELRRMQAELIQDEIVQRYTEQDPKLAYELNAMMAELDLRFAKYAVGQVSRNAWDFVNFAGNGVVFVAGGGIGWFWRYDQRIVVSSIVAMVLGILLSSVASIQSKRLKRADSIIFHAWAAQHIHDMGCLGEELIKRSKALEKSRCLVVINTTTSTPPDHASQ